MISTLLHAREVKKREIPFAMASAEVVIKLSKESASETESMKNDSTSTAGTGNETPRSTPSPCLLTPPFVIGKEDSSSEFMISANSLSTVVPFVSIKTSLL